MDTELLQQDTEEKIEPVQIVTVAAKIPLFKGVDAANAIELIQLKEFGYEIVAQKDLYQIGDKAVYIFPDFCASEMPIFKEFIEPGGDPKKCRLGSNRRIRAIKFNLSRDPNIVEPTYSQGILLPYSEVQEEISVANLYNVNLTQELKIVKWEEPDEKGGGANMGGSSQSFPEWMYKTDEENINNLWGKIQYPITLIGTMKTDGSSITLFCRNGKYGICSRKQLKPMQYNKVVGRKQTNFFHKILRFFKITTDLNIYQLVDSDSEFVRIGKPYLDKMMLYTHKNNFNLILRGELNGKGLKGSGNKNNPSVKNEPNIKFFGADIYDMRTIKLEEEKFDNIIKDLEFERCPVIFNEEFNSKEELLQKCNDHFKGNMIEGIVVRTPDTKFSAKVMNLEYDSKK
jgi:hypothetical protein